ncbi:MAG: lipopolysaccharide biosynthesis protein [Gemmatimonadaceae bacterium]
MIEAPSGVPAPEAGAPKSTAGAHAEAGYLRSTLRHGGIYTLGVILSRLVGFIMIPVYTRVLVPADYGILEILSLTTDILGMLAGMGIGLAVMRQYYAAPDEDGRHIVASSAATLLLGVFAVVAVAGLLAAGSLSPILLGPDQSPNLVRLAVVFLAIGSTIEVPMAMLRARQRSAGVVTIGLVRLMLSLGLNIVFVVVMRLGVAGVLYSSILSALLVGGYLTVQLYRESGVRFDPRVARGLVAFGAPLVLWNISSFVLHYSDRYFLRVFDSLEAVGLYSLGYKLAMLISLMVSGPFSDIWIPKSLEIDRREGERAVPILTSILLVYNLLLVTVAFGVALFAEEVVRLVAGSSFGAAADTVPVLALGMVFFAYRSVGQIGALIRGRSDLIAIATVLAAVVVTLMNILLIPVLGVHGAALATLIAFAFEFFVMRRLSRNVHPLQVPLFPLLRPVVLGALVWWTADVLATETMSLLPRLGIRVAAVGVYGFALFASGAVPAAVQQGIARALREPRSVLAVLRGS